MKKENFLTCAAMMLALGVSVNASAAENTPASLLGAEQKNPVCVLMKFTDDTRFQNLDTSDRLSENLMVRLLQSGQFNLQDHQEYVDGDMEKLLFEDNYQPLLDGKAAIEQGDSSRLPRARSSGTSVSMRKRAIPICGYHGFLMIPRKPLQRFMTRP